MFFLVLPVCLLCGGVTCIPGILAVFSYFRIFPVPVVLSHELLAVAWFLLFLLVLYVLPAVLVLVCVLCVPRPTPIFVQEIVRESIATSTTQPVRELPQKVSLPRTGVV